MLRRALVFFAVLVPCACTLTTDLDGFTGGPDTTLPTEDAGSDATVVDVVTVDVDASDPYRVAVLADAPSAYFPFEEAANAAFATDIVGGLQARVADGSVSFGVPAVRGSGVAFFGSGHLDLGNVFDFAGMVPYTIETWLRYATSNGVFHDYFTKRDDTDKGYAFYVRDEPPNPLRVQFEHNAPNGARGGLHEIVRDTWQHVVVTFQQDPKPGGIGIRVYVNGDLSTEGDYDDQKDAYKSTNALRVGAGFSGVMDEIAFYDHAISADRVKAHYLAGKP